MYQLTDGDLAIIRKSVETGNPNWFTNHYLRSPYSGTYWRAVPQDKVNKLEFPEFRTQAQRIKEGYEKLADVWTKLGEPQYFAPVEGQWTALTVEQYEDAKEGLGAHYRVIYETNDPDPIFHHNHGFIFLPWQLELHQAPQFERVIVGGFGGGKTMAALARMMYHACTLRGYRGFGLAPNSIQSDEFHSLGRSMMTDTLLEEKFLVRSPTRPRPSLVFAHDYVGQTIIECIPVAKEPDKARTVTGDECVIDQSEKFDEQMLTELRRSMGTRFRGMLHGRAKVGTTTYLANSGDSQALWAMFDEAKHKPDDVYALSPPTVWNTYLTVDDFYRFERVVGDDEDSRAMYLQGRRPMGSGVHFSADTLRRIRDDEYTQIIQVRSTDPVPEILPGQRKPKAGYIWRTDPRLGCYYFMTPYDPERQYLVASDAGWNSPPKRDSPAVGAWDITNFPYGPATLVAFSWVFGNHSPDPFIAEHIHFTTTYHAIGMNAFDATAQQAGYDRFFDHLQPAPVSMGGNRKYVLLTLTKTFAARGLWRAPYIPAMFGQLARYDLPDERLIQDIVMMMLVAAHLLEPLYYAVYGQEQETDSEAEPMYYGDARNRYSRPTMPRYVRPKR